MFGDKSKEPTEIYLQNERIDRDKLPKFTRAQLLSYNGTTKKELYVAIRGNIFDVTENTKSYGPGKAYNKLVGKDSSRLFGLNKLQLKDTDGNPENSWDISGLDEKQLKIVDDWIEFFKMRYPIVGIVSDEWVGELVGEWVSK